MVTARSLQALAVAFAVLITTATITPVVGLDLAAQPTSDAAVAAGT